MSRLVSIVILACNQLDYTKQCINSILTRTTVPYELILVDNGSSDQTLDYLRTIKGAKVIHNPVNQGFARGNNQAFRLAKGKYILFLNNDTIVTQHWLDLLLNCLTANPIHGAVGPRTNFAAVTGMPELNTLSPREIYSYARFHNRFNPKKWFTVEWLPAFCLLTKRSVMERVGLFDEKFKLGLCEDVDLGRRIALAGFSNVCAGDTFIYHYGSRTLTGLNLDFEEILRTNTRYLTEKWQKKQQDFTSVK